MKIFSPSQTLYDEDFFSGQGERGARSARVIVPILLDKFMVNSVIDIGCGVGAWLSVFREHGVGDVTGVDGTYVDRAKLRISVDSFIAADLDATLPAIGTADLALCLEVAEHLHTERAESLVAYLTALAPIVAFSAAIPGQGGTGHFNEQWQDYWRALFEARGFQAVDFLRPQIRGNGDVQFWYQQNMICYCSEKALEGVAADPVGSGVSLNLVHPFLFKQAQDGEALYFSKALGLLPGLAVKAARRRLTRLPASRV